MKFTTYILLLFISLHSYSNTVDWNENCTNAYQAIFQFKLDKAQKIIDLEQKNNSENVIPIFLEDYIDFFSYYVSEETIYYNKIKNNFNSKIKIIQSADKSSPYTLYCEAEIRLHYALCKLKNNEYLNAVMEVKRAHDALKENEKKFPDFKANLKSLGLLHTIFGAIPDKYKFGAKLLGFKGSIDQGMQELNQVVKDKTFLFREEAVILYAFLQLHLVKQEDKAWQLIQNANLSTSDNLLNTFVKANMAMHTGKNQLCIDIITNQPKSSDFFPISYLDFMLGTAKLQKLDSDANIYFKKYINNFKGKSYIKEAYRKLAWHDVLINSGSNYKAYMLQCKNFSEAPTDEDKSAQREAERNTIPNKQLLKARVLMDGNYLSSALENINKVVFKNLANNREKLEYYYRKARIYDELNQTANASKYYQITIDQGSKFDYYFAANACIKLGNILEKQNKNQSALNYYNKALQLKKDEYEDSINAEAKAGINRISG
ncbi:MAG: hypothetical protein H6553_02570 [Chitinophagales bacterium]|nr:hypothetical protein [Chitinophagales bacterium]